jgi:glucose-6-phosphate 1-epimerase
MSTACGCAASDLESSLHLHSLHLQAADGASAMLSHCGMQLLSWRTAAGREQLFVSQRRASTGQTPIGSGVQVVFPQFTHLDPLLAHSLWRTIPWQVLTSGHDAQGRAFASLGLQANARTRALWDHAFACELHVRVGGGTLQMDFQVHNNSARAWSFQAALPTYLRVDDLSQARLVGLGLAPFLQRDTRAPNALAQAPNGQALLAGMDRIYTRAPSHLLLREKSRSVFIATQGFADAVVWNPGAEHCANVPELEPHAWRHMLCVGAANMTKPLVLQPGTRWAGRQRLTAMALR